MPLNKDQLVYQRKVKDKEVEDSEASDSFDKVKFSSDQTRRIAKFFPRKSILDREGLEVAASPMRGFLALFWMTVTLYAAISMYKNRTADYLGVSLNLWKRSYRDFEALFVMVATIYLYSYIALPYQWLVSRGILRWKSTYTRRVVQQAIQIGPVLMALFVAWYRSWPQLQTGSLLLFAIVTDLKLHSFLSTNASLDEDYTVRNQLGYTTTGYPNNLNIVDFTRFLWYPTVIYELEYPRTENIRIGYLLERTAGTIVIFCIFYIVLGHYVHPILIKVNDRPFLDSLVDLILPCLTGALLIFFLIFEYLLNWAAELTCFADREFYSDWWNSTDMAEFARKWNRPIHRFLQHHIYEELRSVGHSTFYSRFLTFLYSSLLHELVLSSTTGRLKFWILGLQMSQLPLIYIASALGLRRHPFVANSIWWLMITLGIPVIVLLYSRDVTLKVG